MAFTTWEAYLATLQDALTEGSSRVRSYSTPAGVTTSFFSRGEIQDEIKRVKRIISAAKGGLSAIVTRASFEDS